MTKICCWECLFLTFKIELYYGLEYTKKLILHKNVHFKWRIVCF
jgi:hypothetical protein